MKRVIAGMVICAATIAGAQPKGSSVRLGAPLSTLTATVSSAVDPERPSAKQSSSDTAVLDVSLPKLFFDASEPVTLTAHLHTRGGADIDGADVAVDDQVRAGPMEQDEPKPRRKGLAKGKGRYAVPLDNAPGEHHAIVFVDAVVNGNSVHRGVATSYTVASGELRFLDIGSPQPLGSLLVIPLKVVAPLGGIFTISATIASGQTAVARADTMATLKPGAATVELPFAQQDIVEPGPYRLVNVTANGGANGGLVAGPCDVGQPFQAAHAAHEPPPLRNEYGEIVGVGPKFDPNAIPPLPTPAPVVIPEPEGEPVYPDGSPRPPGPVILERR